MNADVVNSQILRRIRQRLEYGFCQGAAARTLEGKTVWLESPLAQKFCIIGATFRETGYNETGDVIINFLDSRSPIKSSGDSRDIVVFNDSSEKKDVLNFLDGLIKELEDAGR